MLDLRAFGRGRKFFKTKVAAEAERMGQKTELERHGREAIGLPQHELSDFIRTRKARWLWQGDCGRSDQMAEERIASLLRFVSSHCDQRRSVRGFRAWPHFATDALQHVLRSRAPGRSRAVLEN